MKRKNPFQVNKYEIFYRIINSLLAGVLVFLGAFTSGVLTRESIITALFISGVAFISQLKAYWEEQEGEYKTTFFSFIR